MNVGKTLVAGLGPFAQLMEYVRWKTFGRIIERYSGDARVRTLDCGDVFRVMAFAQLTWRESLRDIEACLIANQGKLYHMELKTVPARSTLWEALNQRDWRIYSPRPPRHELATRLIVRARALYANDPLSIDLDATVYALDGHHHRPVLESVRLGAVSFDQGGDQTAHAARPAWRHPELHPHGPRPATQRWQAARRQRAGYFAGRSRRLLCHGSWLWP